MNFRDILNEYNIPIAPDNHHHTRPGWINIDCPLCGRHSDKFHLGYSIAGNYVNCWKCGNHNLIYSLMELTGESYKKIKKLLSGLDIEKFEKPKPKGKLVLPKGLLDRHPAHHKYIKERGFKWHRTRNLWRFKCLALHPKLSWRIFIPLIHRGKMVSWTTRAISKSKRVVRYISAGENQESIPHKELLYGEDYARHAIVVVEGVFDVWRIGQGAVATFGTGFSSAQIERMAKYPVRAICFDNEPEAQKRAKRLVNDLSVFPGDTYNVVLDAKDADKESKKNIKRLRREILE